MDLRMTRCCVVVVISSATFYSSTFNERINECQLVDQPLTPSGSALNAGVNTTGAPASRRPMTLRPLASTSYPWLPPRRPRHIADAQDTNTTAPTTTPTTTPKLGADFAADTASSSSPRPPSRTARWKSWPSRMASVRSATARTTRGAATRSRAPRTTSSRSAPRYQSGRRPSRPTAKTSRGTRPPPVNRRQVRAPEHKNTA